MDHWIQCTFANALPEASQQVRNLRLHELDHDVVEHDIKRYLNNAFTQIRRDHPDRASLANWPTSEEMELLVEKTGVLFVFASTVSRFLSDYRRSPRIKLNEILGRDNSLAAASSYKFLDALYLRVLSEALGEDSHHSLIQRLVATVALAAAPITIDTLTIIIGKDVNAVVHSLSSVLLVPEQPQEPVRAFHHSFHDFLTDKNRCTDTRFQVDMATEHGRFATRCLSRCTAVSKRIYAISAARRCSTQTCLTLRTALQNTFLSQFDMRACTGTSTWAWYPLLTRYSWRFTRRSARNGFYPGSKL
jgi:hypothetical protein